MAFGPSRNRSRKVFETRNPNLIPVMNLFIVIIPMLMTIMISVRLALIEITLPAQSNQKPAQNEKIRKLTLVLYEDRFELKVEDDEGFITIQNLENGTPDYPRLDEKVADLKKRFPNQIGMEILPDPNLKFDTLLRSIDICKSNGFTEVKYLTTRTRLYQAKK